MKFIRCLIPVAIGLLMLQCGQAQSTLDSLVNAFSVYRTQHIQEKLFIHLDRTAHLCGETLWFKVYSVNGATHQPLSLSKVAYIEILSDSGASVMQVKIELSDGMGEGSIFIPATLNTGNYVLRGYTQWMKNYPEPYFFHQVITIINPFKSNQPAPEKPKLSYDAQFLPEGGNLVAGVPSKVAFRVTDSHGRGIDFEGTLVDAHGDTVARFNPTMFGIGTFELTPGARETYTAVISDRNGREFEFPFPEIFSYGYTLSIKRIGSEIRIEVHGRLADAGDSEVFLVAHTRNQFIRYASGKLVGGTLAFAIPADKFAEGVSHITLFDAQLNPVCERLIFTAPNRTLEITPRLNASHYGNREEVALSVHVENETQSAESANLSVSVYKLDSLPSLSQQNIISYLLLASDLHGEIESPETYLQSGMELALDQLMLTHGWRRFQWDHLLGGLHKPRCLPELMGLTISGKLTDATGRPAPNVQSFLSLPSRNSLFFTANSDRAGRLIFLLKNVYDSHEVIFQTNFSSDSLTAYTFTPDDPFGTDRCTIHPEFLKLPLSLEATLIEKSIGLQVNDIFKSGVHASPPSLHDSTAFYGKADETYLLDDYTRFVVMEEVMREYVPGVLVTKRKGKFYLRVRDIVNHGTFDNEPLILIDGVPVFDTDKFMAVNPLGIRKLEAVTKAFFHGPSAFAGIVSLTSYKGDLAGFEPHPRSITLDFKGLQRSRQFYQPRYNTENEKSSREPDARNLLLWVPGLTVKNGKAELRFYTSDVNGRFQIEIQGLDRSGRMGSAKHSFSVGTATP